MVIILSLSYPPEQVKEVARRFRELPPAPSYVTIKGPYVSSEVGVGIKTTSLYEYDQSKTKEAMEYVGSRAARFFGVPGFTYSSQIWLEVNEALKMVGLA
jgi:hypothetical protein